MTSAVWADIVSVCHWLVLCSVSGYAGLLKLLDATAFKSIHTNTAGGAPLWTVKGLSLPGLNGYITCLQVIFQNTLAPFVLTSSRTLTTDQLPLEESLWYSVFLHTSKMSSPSELARDEKSFNAFKHSSVWHSVLPRDTTYFSLASKMDLVKCFYMTAVPGARFTPVQKRGS